MPNCEREKEISAYYDGEMEGSMETHLAECEDCARAFRDMRKLAGLAEALPRKEISRSLLNDLVSIPQRGDLLPTARRLLAVATVLLIASIGFSAVMDRSFSPSPEGWEDIAAARSGDSEVPEEPEAEITRWVVAGLNPNGRSAP